MPMAWKRKPIFEDGQIIMEKQLVKVGNSVALVIPKDWINHFAKTDTEGKYWVRIRYDGTDKIIIGGAK
jgi:hypothetical protein